MIETEFFKAAGPCVGGHQAKSGGIGLKQTAGMGFKSYDTEGRGQFRCGGAGQGQNGLVAQMHFIRFRRLSKSITGSSVAIARRE